MIPSPGGEGRIMGYRTGSTWNILGFAIDCLLKATRLKPVQQMNYLEFAARAFLRRSELVGVSTSTNGCEPRALESSPSTFE